MLKLTAHLCSIYKVNSNEIIIAYSAVVALCPLLSFSFFVLKTSVQSMVFKLGDRTCNENSKSTKKDKI